MSFADVKEILNSSNKDNALVRQKLQEEQYEKMIEELRAEIIDMRTNVFRIHWLMSDTRSLLNARVDICNAAITRVSICFAIALVILALIVFTK